MVSLLVLIDLQKALDRIDHNILLEKLKAIGFCDDTVNWFHSYLPDRAFLVSIENKYSSIPKISCGVPQGSILGPLLFLIYVSDMKQSVSSDLVLYADESCLIFQHKHVTEIENLSGEPMAYKTIKKQTNSRLNYLFRNKHFLTASLRRLLCNALIQPYFDYGCTAWYPNPCKKNEK